MHYNSIAHKRTSAQFVYAMLTHKFHLPAEQIRCNGAGIFWDVPVKREAK